MKSNVYVEVSGEKMCVKRLETAFKQFWTEKGGKIKDIGNVDLYYKPEEKACYYVMPETGEKGKVEVS